MNKASLFYTILMIIGSFIVYLSTVEYSYFILSLGNIIFGIGVNGSVVMISN